MNHSVEIILRLKNVKDLLISPPAPVFTKRFLNKYAEEYIIEESCSLPRSVPIILKVIVPSDETMGTEEIITAIHKHFSFRRVKSDREVARMLRLGWRSLLTGFIFLSVMYLLTKVIKNFTPEDGFTITVKESFIILGWVALWRPAEFLLYEWRPFKRDVNLFTKLEKCEVIIIKNNNTI